MKINKEKKPFLYNSTHVEQLDHPSKMKGLHFGYDPLLGWTIDPSKNNIGGFENNSVYLENIEGENEPIVLFITGGSTSDIIYENYSWPYELFKKMKKNNIRCKIYCAGTGGYGTSQEFLRLVRDGMEIEDLDYHISYFGVNEINEPYDTTIAKYTAISSYSSEYEYNIYKLAMGERSYKLLPNIMQSIQNVFSENFYVTPLSFKRAHEQTIRNLLYMKSLSINHHEFIPILQPAIGVGGLSDAFEKYNLKSYSNAEYINRCSEQYLYFYNNFYKDTTKIGFKVHDFTNVFNDLNKYPFWDDCHVLKEYSHIISDSVFHLIMKYEQMR